MKHKRLRISDYQTEEDWLNADQKAFLEIHSDADYIVCDRASGKVLSAVYYTERGLINRDINLIIKE